jgi:LVIVD repeat
LNVSDPAHPALLGTFKTAAIHVFWKVRIVGGRAYTIGDIDVDTGLVVIDVSSPTAPKLLGSYISPTGRATDVQVAGARAYLTDRLGSLRVLNVNDPAHISQLGTYGNNFASFSAVQIVGSLAYIAEQEENAGDLEIVDVSNPAKLKLVASWHLPAPALDVQVAGSLVYTALDQGGLFMVRFPVSTRVFLPVVRR